MLVTCRDQRDIRKMYRLDLQMLKSLKASDPTCNGTCVDWKLLREEDPKCTVSVPIFSMLLASTSDMSWRGRMISSRGREAGVFPVFRDGPLLFCASVANMCLCVCDRSCKARTAPFVLASISDKCWCVCWKLQRGEELKCIGSAPSFLCFHIPHASVRVCTESSRGSYFNRLKVLISILGGRRCSLFARP